MGIMDQALDFVPLPFSTHLRSIRTGTEKIRVESRKKPISEVQRLFGGFGNFRPHSWVLRNLPLPVMISAKGIECPKLHPAEAELRSCVASETTNISADVGNSEYIKLHHSYDGGLHSLPCCCIVAEPVTTIPATAGECRPKTLWSILQASECSKRIGEGQRLSYHTARKPVIVNYGNLHSLTN